MTEALQEAISNMGSDDPPLSLNFIENVCILLYDHSRKNQLEKIPMELQRSLIELMYPSFLSNLKDAVCAGTLSMKFHTEPFMNRMWEHSAPVHGCIYI
jgi:hypothetical protein